MRPRRNFRLSPPNAAGAEFQGAPGRGGKKKKSNAANKLRTLLLGLTAAVVIGAAAILPRTAADAQIVQVGATDTVVSYTVDVKEASSSLKLVLYNDFTRREAQLSAGENSGNFEGLQPDMRYILAVESDSAFGGAAVETREVRTLSPDEVPVTALSAVEHECTCDVDGLFHFVMEFTDENGWWSQFEATLTDVDGNTAQCVFTDDVHGEQTIDVVGNDLVGNTATFTVSCMSTQNGESGERIVLYSTTVKI